MPKCNSCNNPCSKGTVLCDKCMKEIDNQVEIDKSKLLRKTKKKGSKKS